MMPPAAGKFRLELLGAFRLAAPDGRRIAISSRRAMALLAMLATARDGERTRAWLQDRLWGARQEAQARGSLRRELSDLRKKLNLGQRPLLLATRDRIRLDLDLIDVDARSPAEILDGQEFLEGLDIQGAEEFEDWLRHERTRLAASREEASAGRTVVLRRQAERPVVAVLGNDAEASGEESQIALTVAEDVHAALSRSRMVVVRAWQSSLAHDVVGLPAPGLCAALNADYVVRTRARRRGEEVRVLASLFSGAEDSTVWTGAYDGRIDDSPAVRDQMVAAIASSLEAGLLDHEQVRSLLGVRGGRRWTLLMQGRWRFWRARAGDFSAARDLLAQALELEPDDVASLTLMALCHLGETWSGESADPRASVAAANALASRAVALDGSDAYAHSVLGMVLSTMGQADRAFAEQKRALEINPSSAPAAGELGRLHLFAGDLDQAIAWSDRALALASNDPHAFLWFRTKAFARLLQGRAGEAVSCAADACARSPHQFFLHFLLAACWSSAGDSHKAAAALAEGRRLHPGYSLAMLRTGAPFADPAHVERYIEALRAAGWDG